MKIIFLGVTSKDGDSKGLTEMLNEYKKWYRIDEQEENIIIHNVPRNYRGSIIENFRDVADIDSIRTQNDGENVHNFEASNKWLYTFEELQESLQKDKRENEAPIFVDYVKETIGEFIDMINTVFNNTKKQYTYLRDTIDELNLNMQKPHILEAQPGDLVTCNFGYGLSGENQGITDVIVFKKIKKSQYLVIPVVYIDAENTDSTVDFQYSIITDVFFSDRAQKCYILLDRIQKVSILRFSKIVGKASKNCLNAIYQEFCNYAKDINPQ